ncbi:MAG: CatA-like O-acetyltransferase [Myxococcales bacterium]|nr:CatA-like O-acetyltransferase [Myxococcales bacterium]
MTTIPGRCRIDLGSYPRADIFRAFVDRPMPQFSTTCEVELTGVRRASAAADRSFFVALTYAVSHAVNGVAPFRHRVIDGELYEFDRVDPGYTVAREGDLFSFCDSTHFDDFGSYYDHALKRIEAVKRQPDLTTGDKHHMFFITSVPWINFTAFTQPYEPRYAYIPVITLGKLVERAGVAHMPVAVQVHHGVMDGVHVGRFYERLAELNQNAEAWLR